jgi:hypothetical protein
VGIKCYLDYAARKFAENARFYGTSTYFAALTAQQQGGFGKIASSLRLQKPEDLSQRAFYPFG